ncbi:MAG: hypothetical protein IJA34_10775 [Lachnospiraceae bacterium]|nr:hypothetical protein [Lachnospiraceae bacterium]
MNEILKSFFDDFHIGVYFLQKNARTECHIKDLKNCGIDLVFGIDNDTALLELLHKNGIYAVVSGVLPGWFGGQGNNAGSMSETNQIDEYIKGIEAFVDHPAIIGVDIGDEPSALDFPYYSEVIELIKQLLPDKFPYLNLYPSYGMLASNTIEQIEKELRTVDYQEYIESYCRYIELPYLSFDHYVYSSDKERFFDDLFTVATFCNENKKRLYVILQVNSQKQEDFISEQQLCFQAFSALAYGAFAISWACYSAGWWYNNVLDIYGNKTEQYEKLKNVNHKLRCLTTEYIKYQWVDTVKINFGNTAQFDIFELICSSQDILLGKFEKKDGAKAIFVFSMEPNSTGNILSFYVKQNKSVYLWSLDGCCRLISDTDGVYRVDLSEYEAAFITVD